MIILPDHCCSGLTDGRWFSVGTLVSFTSKTDSPNISYILLNVALITSNYH